jgi:pyruvate formate lyase activating enzyme
MGMVFDIQRSSFHDGPGIRTTVFFKGCSLSCVWCHNPESQSGGPELGFFAEKCNCCGSCAAVCPRNVHHVTGTAHSHNLDRKACTACGSCIKACPQEALKLYGFESRAEEIMEEVLKDRPYYEHTGGGLTISGGEPFYQSDFLVEVLILAKKEGIHCVIETSGFTSEITIRRAIPLTDLFLYDYKAPPSLYKTFTGMDAEIVLSNLALLMDQGAKVHLRCPIIPGCNDTALHFAGIRELEQRYPDLAGIEILPYHALGRGKAAAINKSLKDFGNSADEEQKSKWKIMLREAGCSNRVIQSF